MHTNEFKTRQEFQNMDAPKGEKFVIGYTRYAGIIPVLASIISIYFIIISLLSVCKNTNEELL